MLLVSGNYAAHSHVDSLKNIRLISSFPTPNSRCNLLALQKLAKLLNVVLKNSDLEMLNKAISENEIILEMHYVEESFMHWQ
jgi:hypothetical protein